MGKIPLGYKFDPTVEEIFRYLRNRVHNFQEPNVKFELIKEIDLYQSCPSDHLGLSKSGRIDRKTKDGKGTWHMSRSDEFKMGMKNHLVYCLKGENVKGKGLKTDWIMHEYVLEPADAKVKVNNIMVLCRIYHKNQKESKWTDVCNATKQAKDGSKEMLMMIESSQDYQQKNQVAPENEEFVYINLCSDGDESSQGHDQLKNSSPAKDGRGQDRSRKNLRMIGSSQENQPRNIAPPA